MEEQSVQAQRRLRRIEEQAIVQGVSEMWFLSSFFMYFFWEEITRMESRKTRK